MHQPVPPAYSAKPTCAALKILDAIVVGSGPNGLSAAVALARKGHSVLVIEAADTIGGGSRTKELTLPGFHHDVCSAVHPMAVASSFFREIELEKHGLEWVHPTVPLAHPLDDGTAAVLHRSVAETAEGLGPDAMAYRKLMSPLVRNADGLFRDLVGPFRFPHHPILSARFALRGVRSGANLAESYFRGDPAKALLAGLTGHSQLPLEKVPSAAAAIMLGVAGHAVGWPMPRGGAQRIAEALASVFREAGGTIEVGRRVQSINELPPARAVLFDLTPRQVVAIAGEQFSQRYRQKLERYRYGMGVFKLDWALSGPIPWKAEACRGAGTLHLGGTLNEIAASERSSWNGMPPEKPFVLLTQPTMFDPSRAPPGKHIAWGYCHVPHGSTFDMTERIESQVERFAPGFRSLIIARHTLNPAGMESYNANYIGGEINGGVHDMWQLFGRPVLKLDPYATATKGIFFCSSSTPPGGGVHGLCGYFAARSALRFLRK